MSDAGPIIELIGTETCYECGKLTECISLPDDGDESRSACQECVNNAFAAAN